MRGGKEIAAARSRWRPRRNAPRDEIVIRARSPFLGAKVANLSPALAEELRLDASTEGVVVVDVDDGSPAQSVGFQRGDIVLGSTARRSPRPRDLDRIAAAGARVWRVTIMRGGQQITATFGG